MPVGRPCVRPPNYTVTVSVHPIWLIILAPMSFLAFPMTVAIPIAILAVLVLFFKHDDHGD